MRAPRILGRGTNVRTDRENFNRFSGQTVDDPFEGIDPNKEFHFESGVFVPNDPPGVYPVFNMAHYEGILLSVHFFTDEWKRMEGSAVMVAPGIAFAATHVIEPHIPHVMDIARRMLCIGYTSSGPRFWRVRQFEKVNGTDLMILSLQYASALPAENRFKQAAVTTRLPGIGEQVMIAGLRASNEHASADDQMNFAVKDGTNSYGADVRIGVGEVTEHYLGGRGTILQRIVIEVACSTPGGLSGGPAFDKNGRVFGILSTSFNHEDGRGPSYVSGLVPGLVLPIRPGFFTFPQEPERIRLIESEACSIDRRDVIRWSIIDNGMTRLEYDDYT